MNLSAKVFFIIGLTLFIGFSVLGITSLWLSITSTLKLQSEASLGTASVIRQTIEDHMMKNEPEAVKRYITDLKAKKMVLDLTIYGSDAKSAGAATPDQLVLDSFKKGGPIQLKENLQGTRALINILPLPNEQRCKSCHSEGSFNGAIKLTSSMEEGYASAKKLVITLCSLGALCFMLIVGSMYLFFRLTIIKNIVTVSKSIDCLSQGEGDLTAQLKVHSTDEIGVLTEGVNRLIFKLRDIISDLYGHA